MKALLTKKVRDYAKQQNIQILNYRGIMQVVVRIVFLICVIAIFSKFASNPHFQIPTNVPKEIYVLHSDFMENPTIYKIVSNSELADPDDVRDDYVDYVPPDLLTQINEDNLILTD